MPAPVAAALTIASAIFIAELTDKDALFLLALATRERSSLVFMAGASAFTATTALFVTAGSLLTHAFPVALVRVLGGCFMLGYAAWEAKAARGAAEGQEGRRGGSPFDGWRGFLGVVASLAILDITGDATEVLTIVFAAQYSNALLVFAAACGALISATAVETGLGRALAAALTRERLRYISVVVPAVLGAAIIITSLA